MLPNFLSLLRIPLAFVFLSANTTWRATAVLLALVTDGLDGQIARYTQTTSRLGTFLDPFTDRFFVIFALGALYSEGSIEAWQIFALLMRDIAILSFALYLFMRGTLQQYYLRALWSGKVATCLQLLVLFTLALGGTIPHLIYQTLFVLGPLAFVELFYSDPKIRANA